MIPLHPHHFSQARLLIVGDIMLDSYWQGLAARISPEAPVPVVQVNQKEVRLGGAANVALNAAALNAQVHLIGFVGTDSAADQIETLLTIHKISHTLQRVQNSHTITKLRVLSHHQQLIRLDSEDSFLNGDWQQLKAAFIQQLTEVDIVIFSDYAKGALRDISKLIKLAKKHQVPVIVDPKGNNFTPYQHAHLITPNLAEFEAVVGYCDSDQEIEQRAMQLCAQLQLEAILITRSEHGMTLVTHQQKILHLPTQAKEVFDVTGAGDTVAATLGVALASGLTLTEAVRLSNAAASIVVSKLGTATVTYSELYQILYRSDTAVQYGILHIEELQQQIQHARIAEKQIVMTNGCFDLLHPGHIAYLSQARALGNYLIVAVNDDASVKRLKGKNRPINSLATRMQLLAALKCVDWVIAFSEDTPELLINKLKPDILVKGGDYTIEQIAGASAVQQNGGQVKIIEFLPGYSSSLLIEKIRNNVR